MPVISPCPDLPQLERLALGRLPAPEADTLEEHVNGCTQCGEAVGRLAAMDPLVEAMRARVEPLAEADRALVQELIGRLKILCPSVLTGSAESLPSAARMPPEGYALLAPSQGPDEIGRLGPYRVLGVVGRGGMGVVFRAEDPRVKRGVALKVLLDARGTDPHYLARFQVEAEAVARLRHPNIVQLHEVGEQAGRPYLVLEYIAGGSLAEHLAGRPQPPRASAELTAALAGAIHHAHERGVVHRDLKPSNILLQKNEGEERKEEADRSASPFISHPLPFVPKITDFGLAKRLDEEGLTQSDDLLGTPSYMAPELTRGRGPSGDREPAADIYGLGAILYELLTGRPPFRGETVADTLEQVRALDPVPVRRLQPKVPRDLNTICHKCLEKEPAHRYASARDLADDLGRFLRGEPIRARPVSWRERLGKWARRKPALAALLAVSGLSLGILVAGALVYNARLETALTQAENNAQKAHQQQKRADNGYRAARDTLDRMRQRLQQRRLGEVPQLKELQRDLLEDELRFYEGVLRQADDPDPTVRRDTAWAYRYAADIQMLLGRQVEAVKNLGRAINLVEALPPAEREGPEAQALLAGSYSDRGILVGASGRIEAERDLLTALDIFERRARAHPHDPGQQEDLARAEHQLGHLYQSVGRLADAARHTGRAVTLRTALVRDYPAVEPFQAALAEDYVNLGIIYGGLARHAEAVAAYEKADALLRPLVARHPGEVLYALSLASVCINWSYYLADGGQVKVALARVTRAVELTEDALRREPHLSMARERTYKAHGARAQMYERLGRFADAVTDWDRAIELDDQPNPWMRRAGRALALAKAGDHARAAAQVLALEGDATVTGDGLYHLATTYVAAIGAARKDARLSAAEREALAGRYGSRSVALLQKLQAQGYFKEPANALALRTDLSLWPLWGRADYWRLLASVGGK